MKRRAKAPAGPRRPPQEAESKHAPKSYEEESVDDLFARIPSCRVWTDLPLWTNGFLRQVVVDRGERGAYCIQYATFSEMMGALDASNFSHQSKVWLKSWRPLSQLKTARELPARILQELGNYSILQHVLVLIRVGDETVTEPIYCVLYRPRGKTGDESSRLAAVRDTMYQCHACPGTGGGYHGRPFTEHLLQSPCCGVYFLCRTHHQKPETTWESWHACRGREPERDAWHRHFQATYSVQLHRMLLSGAKPSDDETEVAASRQEETGE